MVQNQHYICIPCRYDGPGGPCPHCLGEVIPMGKNFRAPRRTNQAQWRKVELIVQNRRRHHPNCFYAKERDTREVRYYHCGCPYFADYRTPADVKSGLGLRRSRKKNWALPSVIKGRPRPKYDYGRQATFH